MANWEIDPKHSTLRFSVRNMVIARVSGGFERWTGKLQLDEKNLLQTRVAVSVDAASVNTGVPDRDAHLRSADFFNVEQFPTVEFTSTRVERVNERRFKLVGELSLRGVTREVALDVTHNGQARDPWGMDRLGFSARTTLSRRDFGLTWNQLLAEDHVRVNEKLEAVLVGDAVELEIELQAMRPGA